jgi:predicted esterase
VIERTIAATTHGRYLVSVPVGAGRWPLLVGCHGYAEDAAAAMPRLEAIDPGHAWLRVAIQGLNRFYRNRRTEVIAGWMTRQDRELAIADNQSYVASVVDAVDREWPTTPPLVFTGFSQGVAMAFRAAAASPRAVAGVAALGGDIPPEIDGRALACIGCVLIGRGTDDRWYTAEKLEADRQRLAAAGVVTDVVEFAGGHEWSDAFSARAAAFLRPLRS